MTSLYKQTKQTNVLIHMHITSTIQIQLVVIKDKIGIRSERRYVLKRITFCIFGQPIAYFVVGLTKIFGKVSHPKIIFGKVSFRQSDFWQSVVQPIRLLCSWGAVWFRSALFAKTYLPENLLSLWYIGRKKCHKFSASANYNFQIVKITKYDIGVLWYWPEVGLTRARVELCRWWIDDKNTNSSVNKIVHLKYT